MKPAVVMETGRRSMFEKVHDKLIYGMEHLGDV